MDAYRAAQQAVREEEEIAIHARDRRALRDILSAPRNERSKRFWKHVNRAKPKSSRRSKIRSGDGELMNKIIDAPTPHRAGIGNSRCHANK